MTILPSKTYRTGNINARVAFWNMQYLNKTIQFMLLTYTWHSVFVFCFNSFDHFIIIRGLMWPE